MGLVVSYDDNFETPSSEIKLDSGEHILLALDKSGLVIKSLAGPGRAERILFKAKPNTVAAICAGLFDDEGRSKTSPLQILVSAATHLPNTAAVEDAFNAAADAV